VELEGQFEVGLAGEEALCFKNGMRYTSFPIADRDVPQKVDALALAADLFREISEGEHVVIHCRAGVDRTGIIASAVLIQAGCSSGEAIHMILFARGSLVPDTEEQGDWIRSLDHLD
jgi:protein-tyrosine phosphatase